MNGLNADFGKKILSKWTKNDEVWTVTLCFTFCVLENLQQFCPALWLEGRREEEGEGEKEKGDPV